MRTDRSLLQILFFTLVLAAGAAGDIISAPGSGVTIKLDTASGDYSIDLGNPDWSFRGSISQPAVNAAKKSGSDNLGGYAAITFDWQADGPNSGEIRAYSSKPLVQFILTCHSPQTKPPAAFPTLQPPKGLHLFSYADSTFSPPKFSGQAGGTPWLMFDDAAHAAILSPASNFMIASMRSGTQVEQTETAPEGGDNVIAKGATTAATQTAKKPASRPAERLNQVRKTTDGPIASGLVSTLRDIPAEFSHRTLLAFGDGINTTWNNWGQALTDLSGKKRPANDADTGLKYFGYWTDNGAGYYYNYDSNLGYADTLLALKKKMTDLGIPLGYVQLDSWWYIKSNVGPEGKVGDPFKNKNLPRGSWNMYGGLIEYVAHPDLFPDGLPAFSEKMGVPFVTHNRWIDLQSPYREKYKISGVAAVDPKWWDDIADYLKKSGVITYEQDWLDRIYKYSPEFQTTTTAGDAFLDNMSRATRERGMTMQYCMELPRYYLQGSKYDNLTTVRVSNDRFQRDRWEYMLYVSQLAASLGEWPWVDTFDSNETPNLILANLTAGMVGVGDKMNAIDAANIRKVIRGDGVIVKPDTPIVPIDQTYVDDASGKESPMIAAAYTDHGARRTAYVFAYPRNQKQLAVRFRPVDVGVQNDAYVYDPISDTAEFIPPGATFESTFHDRAVKSAWAYLIVTPSTRSGIALIGDKGKFVSDGRQRIPVIEETSDGLRATIVFASGEKGIELHGFSPDKPRVDGAGPGEVGFNPKTHGFTVTVSPAQGSTEATVTISTANR